MTDDVAIVRMFSGAYSHGLLSFTYISFGKVLVLTNTIVRRSVTQQGREI